MPELPEVETIRQLLTPQIVNRRITNVIIHRDEIVGHPTLKTFVREIKGKSILTLNRKGKYLLIGLNRGWLLIIHLRLSGHLRVVKNEPMLKYERLRLKLNNCQSLVFIEPRVLGKVYLVKEDNLPPVLSGLKEMGLEPIDPRFTAKYLTERLKGKSAKIKTLLLDQRICAGAGNIYSDEALFGAGIKPVRRANSLTKREISNLTKTLRQVLNAGIKYLGTTMRDERYLLPDGATGRFQERLKVFNRENLPCSKCGNKIQRVKIGNRSSYFCPVCQK